LLRRANHKESRGSCLGLYAKKERLTSKGGKKRGNSKLANTKSRGEEAG